MMFQSCPILLIEDNPMDVDLTRRTLTRNKVLNPIEIARDGEEALAYLARWETGEPLPVVILLDVHLPKISGLEVLRQLRAHPLCQKVPIIVLLSSAQSEELKDIFQSGADSYLVKPLEFDDFMDVITHVDLYWNLINALPT